LYGVIGNFYRKVFENHKGHKTAPWNNKVNGKNALFSLQVRFELTTNRLTVECSTAELLEILYKSTLLDASNVSAKKQVKKLEIGKEHVFEWEKLPHQKTCNVE
jgi:hypothetical protein